MRRLSRLQANLSRRSAVASRPSSRPCWDCPPAISAPTRWSHDCCLPTSQSQTYMYSSSPLLIGACTTALRPLVVDFTAQDFFGVLGGTSITALRLLVALRKDEHVRTRVTPTELFQNPTVRRLAKLVSSRANDASPATPSEDTQGEIVVLQPGDTAGTAQSDEVCNPSRTFHPCYTTHTYTHTVVLREIICVSTLPCRCRRWC